MEYKNQKEFEFCFHESETAAETNCLEKIVLLERGRSEDGGRFGKCCVQCNGELPATQVRKGTVVGEIIGRAYFGCW